LLLIGGHEARVLCLEAKARPTVSIPTPSLLESSRRKQPGLDQVTLKFADCGEYCLSELGGWVLARRLFLRGRQYRNPTPLQSIAEVTVQHRVTSKAVATIDDYCLESLIGGLGE
jgi:hypothetical protein